VATFQFEIKELGQRISDAEMEEFKKSRYGDVRVRQATVAESPAQLLLEAAAAKQWGSTKTDSAKTSAPSIASNGLVAPEVPATKPVGAPEGVIKGPYCVKLEKFQLAPVTCGEGEANCFRSS